MEIKLSVNIGATLQVKNAKGDWDWIKPEVGCEIKLIDGEIKADTLPTQFAVMWDEVVGPQFASVVRELLNEQLPEEEASSEVVEESDDLFEEKPNTDEDDYY